MAAKAESSVNLKVVEKIPFFRGLSFNQIRQVLQAGQLKSYQEGNVLCYNGDKSREIFILLAGELVVKDDDVELARIKPVEIVGEMGMITNEPRCASIEVVADATLMVIGKMQFDVLLKNDIDMAVKIYKNMIDSLSQKLRDNNIQLTKTLLEADPQIAASAL